MLIGALMHAVVFGNVTALIRVSRRGMPRLECGQTQMLPAAESMLAERVETERTSAAAN
jgi:hypothetical protein